MEVYSSLENSAKRKKKNGAGFIGKDEGSEGVKVRRILYRRVGRDRDEHTKRSSDMSNGRLGD